MNRLNDTRYDRVLSNPAQRGQHRNSDRFRTLLCLARSGDDTAIHDIWAEFQFDFEREDSAHE